jgi:hypothetical protein
MQSSRQLRVAFFALWPQKLPSEACSFWVVTVGRLDAQWAPNLACTHGAHSKRLAVFYYQACAETHGLLRKMAGLKLFAFE